MLKNMSHSCFKIASFIRPPVSILLIMEWLGGRIDTSLKLSELYNFKCRCPSISRPMRFPPLVLFINRMPSSVLNWGTPYHTIFPNKLLFLIKPRVFRCMCFVRNVRLHVSILDPKSLSVSSLVTLEFRSGIGAIVLVFAGTQFLLMSPFLRIFLFLKTRSTLVRGRMMICSFILLPHQLLLLFLL